MDFIGSAVVSAILIPRDGNPLPLYFLPYCFRNGMERWAQDRLLMADVQYFILGFN